MNADECADKLCLDSIAIGSAITFVLRYGDKISEAELANAKEKIVKSLYQMGNNCRHLASCFQ